MDVCLSTPCPLSREVVQAKLHAAARGSHSWFRTPDARAALTEQDGELRDCVSSAVIDADRAASLTPLSGSHPSVAASAGGVRAHQQLAQHSLVCLPCAVKFGLTGVPLCTCSPRAHSHHSATGSPLSSVCPPSSVASTASAAFVQRRRCRACTFSAQRPSSTCTHSAPTIPKRTTPAPAARPPSQSGSCPTGALRAARARCVRRPRTH